MATRMCFTFIFATFLFVTVRAINEDLVNFDFWDVQDDKFIQSSIDYDRFDWAITKHIAASSTKNFLLSPLGLKLALASLTEAATGVTQAELKTVIGFDLDKIRMRRKFSTIVNSLKKESPGYDLNFGNRIVYVEEGAPPRTKFQANADEFYKTEVNTLNISDPAAASKEINEWVSSVTHKRIPDIVNEDDVRNMVMLILNIIYFKGNWRYQFTPNATTTGYFNVSPDKQSHTTFMNVKGNFYYTESIRFDAKILRIPYRCNKFSMYIIVPNSITGLPRVLNRLDYLYSELLNLEEHLIDLTLPKFKYTYVSQMDGVLKEMGVHDVFNDTAILLGIARAQYLLKRRLKVSRVLQRSSIEVNELGNVAYSTAELSANRLGEESVSSYEINANRPFLFFIQDEPTRQLLFTGRVSDPALDNGAFKPTELES